MFDAVLAALEAAGLARRVQPAGAAARFEARTTDHHHVVCRECGAITDVDGPRHPPTATDLSGVPDGFVADHVELTLWGRCAACVAAGETPTPARSSLDPKNRTNKEHRP